MTDREKAIVMAYTGVCMLSGDKFQTFHKYVEKLMGRPLMSHEIYFYADEIKEKAKADFIALCADESEDKEMTNQEKFIQTFGLTTWQAMIVFTGLAEQYKEYWTSPYKESEVD